MNIKDNKINFIKSKNKNTMPKTMMLHYANIYSSSDDMLIIATKINLILLGISLVTNMYYNLFYGLSFICIVMSLLYKKEEDKALTKDFYKEIDMKNTKKINKFLNFSNTFIFSYMFFLQGTIISLVFMNDYYKYFLVVPFLYLMYMLYKGFHYNNSLIVLNDLNKIRKNILKYLFLLLIISICLKFLFKVSIYFSLKNILVIFLIVSIIGYFYSKNIFLTSFKVLNKDNDNYIYPIYNYMDYESIKKIKNDDLPATDTSSLVDLYLAKADKELKDIKLRKEKDKQFMEEVEAYKINKRRNEEKEKANKKELEYLYGLSDKPKTKCNETVKQNQVENTESKNQFGYTSRIKPKEDCSLNRLNQKNKR